MTTSSTQERPMLARIAANALSLLTSDVLNKATTFAVYAMVARYVGTRAFGQLSLGLLLLYAFQVFATVGLPILVTRAVTRRRRRTGYYFVHASLAVSVTSLAATVAMVLLCIVMRYDSDTSRVIALLSLGLVPYALATVNESIFRAWERMHLIAIANVPANIAKMVGAYLLLDRGNGIIAIAMLLLGCRVAILAIEWICIVRFFDWTSRTTHLSVAWRLARRASTFLWMDGLIAIWASVDAVLLSKFASEAEVGLYSAACQLLIPATLFYQSIVSSVFPTMCRLGKARLSELGQLARWLFDFLLTAGIPAAVLLFFLAEPLLKLLYGNDDFMVAGNVVRILSGVLLFRALTAALGHALWATSREQVTLKIVAANLVINVVVGLILIPIWGLTGAALAALTTWSANAVLHWVCCSQLLKGDRPKWDGWKAIISGIAMAICFAALQRTTLLSATVVAVSVYVLLVGLLLVYPHGGFRQFRAVYFAPLLR